MSAFSEFYKSRGKKPIAGFISLGGGSVGDFTGFLASVFHRGTPVVHIPSTWLAAMDSAHGGKTALNVGNIKNILGSYHSPQACFIIRKLFLSLAPREIQSAGGELLKTAFITGGQLYSNIKQKPLHPSRLLWQCLPSVIRTKLQIVKKDFFRQNRYTSSIKFWSHNWSRTRILFSVVPWGNLCYMGWYLLFNGVIID